MTVSMQSQEHNAENENKIEQKSSKNEQNATRLCGCALSCALNCSKLTS
jgi:hypothetical protein